MKNIDALRVLSLGVGFLLLFYGIDKVLNGVEGIVILLKELHVPYSQYVAYFVLIGEVVAPLLLIAGRYVQIAGGLIVANMIIAIILANREVIFQLNANGGWSTELPMLYLIAGLTLALSKK